jgi:hypothetical protein
MVIGRREVLFWCALAVALLMANVLRTGGPGFMNDSYQYLSTAENITAGNGVSTSIVNFDIERRSQRVPAPLTTFPPGYAVAIAEVNRTGLDPERAGLLFSMLSFVALFPLLAWGARVLELRPNITRLVLFWLLANSWVAEYPLQILTESTFTALTTFAVVAFMAAERRDKAAPRSLGTLLLGGVLVGLSYWVRYAGLFLFAAVLAYFALSASIRRDRRSLNALLCGAVPLGIIGLGFARNIVLTSSWQGGNTKKVFHPILPTLKGFVISIYHLLFGEKVVAHVGLVELLLAAAALTLGALAIYSLRTESILRLREAPYWSSLVLLWAYLAIYSLGMIYLGVVSVISFGTRMFYPILPLLLLSLGHLLGGIEKAVQKTSPRRLVLLGSTALLTACYLVINVRSLGAEPTVVPHQLTEARFAAQTADGEPLRAWIDANMPEDAVLIATDAQPTAYVLKRRTVALTESEYSDEVWGPSELQALMTSYGADFIILYPTAHPSLVAAQRESPFLAGLLEGELPPWLGLAAENKHVKVFRRLAPPQAVHRAVPGAVLATGERP